MFSLTNPWVLIGILSLAISSFFYGHHQAYIEQQLEVDRLNALERDKEHEMQAIVDNQANELKKANSNAQNQISKLQSDITSGQLRLSIATRTIQTSSDSTTSPGNTESRSEFDPEAANALVSIAADGDKAIRSLNACIDTYEQIRSKQ